MAATRIILDNRFMKKNGRYPVKIRVSHKKKTVYLATGVEVEENGWDGREVILCDSYPTERHVKKANNKINRLDLKIDDVIDDFERKRLLPAISAQDIKSKVEAEMSGKVAGISYTEFFRAQLKEVYSGKAESTKSLYEWSLELLHKFNDEQNIFFEDMTPSYLVKFDNHLMNKLGLKPHSRSIVFRNLKSVFNDAMDDRVVSRDLYPFRKFAMPKVSARKLGLTASHIKAIAGLQLEEYSTLDLVRDAFILSFLLIGMNPSDLYDYKGLNQAGQVDYIRRKTKTNIVFDPHPYALKVIDKWEGKRSPLMYQERYKLRSSFVGALNTRLKQIGAMKEVNVPDLKMYHARHTWATVAADLDIPDKTIAAALGHQSANSKAVTSSVTDLYIKFNIKKIAEANEKVVKACGCFN